MLPATCICVGFHGSAHTISEKMDVILLHVFFPRSLALTVVNRWALTRWGQRAFTSRRPQCKPTLFRDSTPDPLRCAYLAINTRATAISIAIVLPVIYTKPKRGFVRTPPPCIRIIHRMALFLKPNNHKDKGVWSFCFSIFHNLPLQSLCIFSFCIK